MRWQRIAVFCTMTVLALGVIGCKAWQKVWPQSDVPSTPAKGEGNSVTRQQAFTSSYVPAWRNSQFEDIAIPPDCVFVPEESFVHAEAGMRIGDVKYEAKEASVADTFKFFRENMPTSNWKFLRLCGVRMKSLMFVKGNEECTIRVGKEEGVTIVRIKVHRRTN